MEYIEFNGYTKTLKKVDVLSNVNLKIEKGEIMGLLGRNGSGKTMMLRALAGLILATSGTLSIDGNVIDSCNRFNHSTGLIIETMKFWPNLTAKETLEVLCAIKSVATKEDIEESLVRVGLDPNDKKPVNKFSLGMTQKLAIAQAIIEKPDLLLLDEPTNSLDETSRHMFYDILKEENERGATIVLSSHYKEDLDQIVNRVVALESGEVTTRVMD